MMKALKYSFILLMAAVIGMSFIIQTKPTLYIIGDSTTKNNLPMMGWGQAMPEFFDLSKIDVNNQAIAGRSTRSFVREGRWDKVTSMLKPGDYVMMVFGHNEGTPPDTTAMANRGVLHGIGEDSVVLKWHSGKTETVHTYGWYFRKFIRETKAKGATPIVLSMIPRNEFRNGKVLRADKDYGLWAKQVADQEGAIFIDLNSRTADKYDKWGPDSVKKIHPQDHTHTTPAGARVNAQSVAEGIKADPQNPLNKYLNPNAKYE